MTSDEFKKLGYELIDFIAEYRQQLEQLPVQAQVQPGEIKALFESSPPQKAQGFEGIVGDLEALQKGLTGWQSPNFYSWFPSNTPLHSVLADLVVTGWGNTGITWLASPALTEVEEVMTDWMRQMLGLPETFQGVIHDTASTATFVAMLCARERSSNLSFERGGLQAEVQPLVVYSSAQSHSSVPKGVLLAGFGRENLGFVELDDNFDMRPDALEAAIQADIAAGKKPCAVIVAIGTTGTTAFDPLEAIVPIAQKYGLWAHVDAAMAGSAMILPEMRHLWAGIEQADSICLNPHKWLGVGFDCTLYYVRDPELLIRVMSTNPSYLQSAADGRIKNYKDWGIQLGRRFRALKIWFALKAEGVEGLQARLRRDLENARWLEAQIHQTPGWKILAPVRLQTLCVRHEPEGLTPEQISQHNKAWQDRINASGRFMLTPAILGSGWIARVSIGTLHQERKHIEALWAAMQEESKITSPDIIGQQ